MDLLLDQVPINLDISFPALKCENVHLDAEDSKGNNQIDVHGDNVKKTPWVHPLEEPVSEMPGCRIKGNFNVEKVAGNMHVALGKDGFVSRRGTKKMHVHQFTMKELEHFNTSHVINRLDFGADAHLSPGVYMYIDVHCHSCLQPTSLTVSSGFALACPLPFSSISAGKEQPLDKHEALLDDKTGTARFQYFVKVVPTVYKTLHGRETRSHQFSVTEHVKKVKLGSGSFPHPGVFIKYDFVPIMMTVEEEKRTFSQFLTGVCAIVGGVFTVAGMCDSFIYQTGKALSKKSH